MSSSMHDSVAEVMANRFGMDRDIVVADATFDDLGLDSLSQIELATALTKQLGVELDDDEMAELSTVGEIVALLESKGAVAR
ncbi:acyl carrier protein [Streptomyces flavochromogenes]|uniref:Acyl carrier protein n=1 Tax=Streptomyces flavochromogenes TaxID=68199 RepID=A0ABW6XQ25_9ACTN|nr:acyl carrier protein [Streptomyces flavochromogenes]